MRNPICCLLWLPAAALAGSLNDTGIDYCRNHLTGLDVPVTSSTTCSDGQDARYGRDPASQRGTLAKAGSGPKGFDFTKVANNGSLLPASAVLGTAPSDWACTYDNTTGLMWEVKTNGGLHSSAHSYSWYDSVHSYGGNSGAASLGTCETLGHCDTEKFVADVNADGLCNHKDWRLPTLDELANLADLSIALPGPVIDSGWFPNTLADMFWSASPYAGDNRYAWGYGFHRGGANWYDHREAKSVRLVRSGK